MKDKGVHNYSYEHDDGSSMKKFNHDTRDEKSYHSEDASTKTSKKFQILKNVVIISFAFTFLFTSFNSMANLQSSINKTLGTTSLWVIYVSLVLSCAFIPSYMIKRLKAKWTLPICMLCYSSYIAAQFYPRYYTLIPTAFLLGLGAAPMWSAKCTYLTQVGQLYADIVGEDAEVIITRFFGIFFLFFQSSQVWGNLISSSVLSQGVADMQRSDEFLEICGANFCPEYSENLTALTLPGPEYSENLTAPTLPGDEEYEYNEKQKIRTMSYIYLACSLASVVIVAVFVDPLSKFDVKETAAESKSAGQLLVASFTHMLNINQILIIPLTMWSGVEQAFIGADFTAAFVTCGLGVHMVGYVMICYGVCDAICSMTFSPLVKRFGRVPIFTFGAITNVILFIVMLSWKPNPDEYAVFFIIAALWGTADAIWQTQINAFYGVIFPGESEPAFSNYRLWESIGFILAYVCSTLICVDAKIYMLIFFLGTGMTGYYAIEYLEKIGGLKVGGVRVRTVSELF